MKILIIEDDETVAHALKLLLTSYNYAVDLAADGEAGMQLVNAYEYNLVVLDVVLPKLDGISLCQQVRALGLQVPILLLTGRDESHQKVVALNSGADDYVVKPFDTEELMARVQALLRRGSATMPPVLTWGDLQLDPSQQKTTYGTRLLTLTPKEYAILELFLRNSQKVLSANVILDQVWNSLESPGEEAIRVHIKELRQRLRAVGAPSDFIKTVYRFGYRLNPLYSSFHPDQHPTVQQVAELQSVNEELRTTLEELRTAEEELRQQNEELAIARQAMEQERQKYQDLFEFAPDGYLVTNSQGIIQEANRAIAALLAVEAQYLIGKPLTTFIARSDSRAFRSRLSALDLEHDWEVTLQPRQGDPVPVLMRVTSLKNPHNQMVTLRWLLRDIRHRKQMEQRLQSAHNDLEMRVAERTAELVLVNQSLRQRDHQWQALFEHALEAIAIVDDDGQYIEVNPATCTLHEVSRDDLLGQRFTHLTHPELDAAQWQQFLQDGQLSGEVSLRCPDGTLHNAEYTAVANFIPHRHLLIMRYSSERKRSETERQSLQLNLQASETKLQGILDNATVSISSFRVFANHDWDYEYWSRGCEVLFGYTAQDLMADKHLWLSRVLPDDRDQVVMPLIEEFLAGYGTTIEYRFACKDGSVRWFSSEYTVRQLREDCWIVTAVNYDINDRKQKEATLKQQLAREQLVAEVTSQIRQTLNVDDVLHRAVNQIRLLLNTDRVLIFRFQPSWQGTVVMESVASAWPSLLHTMIYDPCFSERYIEPYRQGRVSAIANLETSGLEPCYLELLSSFQVKANLVVPILQGDQLWGLLITHHCSGPRHWQDEEIELLKQLANQLSIAIQQSELYEQTRRELLERKQMQDALEESEERFRSLSASAPIGILQTTADGICLYANARWQTMSGLPLDDCLGDGWTKAIHPGDRDQVVSLWNMAVCQEQEFTHEFRLLTPQHNIRWVSVRAAPIRSDGSLIGYVITQEDTTERKQSEIQLRKMSMALSHAVEGISQLDEQGRYMSVNDAYAGMVGYTPDEMIGMDWKRTVHSDDLERVTAAYQRMLTQGKVELEARGNRKDGSVFYKQLSMVPTYNEQQQFVGHYCFMKDISDEKRLEADRKLAEQKIREQATLLNIASDAILVRDLNHHILYWNQGAERLYGWQAAEAMGQQANELLQNQDSPIEEIMQTLLEQGEWQGEIRNMTKTGRQVTVEARWTLVVDEVGQEPCILEVDTDVTDKKQLAAQFYRAQRLESVGTLVSGIAHDLNNVFTPILSISQLIRLKQQHLDEQSQEMLKVLEDSARRGAGLVKQILIFARGTEGQRVPLQIGYLLSEVTQVVEQTFPKSIHLRKDIPTKSLRLVSADPTQLHQVFMNLCVNARDAMPTGGTLSLSAKNYVVDATFAQMNLDACEGSYVQVTLSDTGTGIAPELLDRIFDPFFTTKEPGKGTGLGLSTVIGIVKSHGGFLQVFSEVGKGSQFKVYLPTVNGTATTRVKEEVLKQGHGELILVVDDDDTVRRANQSLLESHHYTTLVASDGLDAIVLYARQQDEIKIVLLDIMMPNMDGITAIQTLRKMNPDVTIIATSGLLSNRPQALSAGAKAFLPKPYTADDLLSHLHNLLLVTPS